MSMQHVLQMSEQLVLEKFIKNIHNKIYCGLRRGPIVTIYTKTPIITSNSIVLALSAFYCSVDLSLSFQPWMLQLNPTYTIKKYRDYSPMVGV